MAPDRVTPAHTPRPLRVDRYALVLALAWAATVGTLCVHDVLSHNGETRELARIQARSLFDKDVVYRRWNSEQGGVYVPVTPQTPPNPYLSHLDNRDLTTESGLTLTLVNPAYMTRQVHELGRNQYGHRGHITSLNLLRPENAPDPWETDALRAFERGETEVTSPAVIEGEDYLRLMRPLFVEQRCLKCHEHQGYQVGDVGGGISVSVPMDPLRAVADRQVFVHLLALGVIWLLGTALIGIGARNLQTRVSERARADETLRNSEHLHRRAIEALEGTVYRMTLDDRAYEFISDAVHRMTGYSSDEITPQIFRASVVERNMVGPLAASPFAEADRAMMEGEIDHWRAEVRILTKDGDERWLTNAAAQSYDEEGRLTAIGILLDITERKQMEEALRKSEKRYRELADSIDDVFFAMDGDLRYTYWNRASEELTGISARDAIGKPLNELFPDTKGTKAQKAYLEVLRTRQPQSFESEYRLGDRDFIFEISAYPFGDGISVFVNDVTERKKAAEALRESEAAHRGFLENLGVGVVVHAPDTTILYCNPSATEILRLTRDQMLGRTAIDPQWKFVREDARDLALEDYPINLTLRTGKALESYVIGVLHARSAGVTWVACNSYHVRDADGELRHVVISFSDITDRKRLEEEVRRAHNLESLGTLAGGIAHDFNNVLTGVIGNLALLARMLDKDSKEYEIVAEARQSADRTRDLTRQLMAFAKGGAPVKETASIEALIRQTADLSLSGSNTKPTYLFAEDLSPADIDGGQIGQVIQNLVLNADQAMPDGGNLKMSAENVEVLEDDSLPLEAGRYVKVAVEDEGIGMSEDVLARIFDPYYTTKPRGHGLGLSIAHTIISNHGGHITATSAAGEGTTFEVHLPASEKQAVEAPEQETKPASGSGKILLMDDEETIHRTMGRMLGELGYEVAFASEGDEALQTYQAAKESGRPFDLVIMDLTVPGGMGGKEAVGKLHEIDPDARVVVSSGYSNDPVMANPEIYGFVGIVKKPVDLDELARTVREAIG